MSGESIPYHLRHSKAIDRNLFVDLLACVGRAVDLTEYTYIGLGGPFLEDFKALHGSLNISKLTSLESSPDVHRRQMFNRPVAGMKLLRLSTGDFLDRHEIEGPTIAWFDFTSPRQVYEQLAQLQRLIAKLAPGDVWRITLNAHLGSLGENATPETRLQKLRARLGEYAPSSLTVDDLTKPGLPRALLRAVEIAAKQGIQSSPDCVVDQLAAFCYADGQQMLSVTGVVLDQGERTRFLSKTKLHRWPFYSPNWSTVRDINVPILSTRERFFLESLLPQVANGRVLAARLGYSVADSEDLTREQLDNFIRFYRLYPAYSKVVL